MSQAHDEAAATSAPLKFDDLSALQLDALREVGNIGAGTAAASLSTMTGQPVAMGVPSVKVVPIEEVPDDVGGGESIVVAVYMQVIGDAPGHIIFILEADTARELCDTLMAAWIRANSVRPASARCRSRRCRRSATS